MVKENEEISIPSGAINCPKCGILVGEEESNTREKWGSSQEPGRDGLCKLQSVLGFHFEYNGKASERLM